MDPNNRYNGYASMIVTLKGTIYVAYRDSENGNKVTVKRCLGLSNPIWETIGGESASSGEADYVCLQVLNIWDIDDANDIPYIAFKDGANGGKVTVRKFE